MNHPSSCDAPNRKNSRVHHKTLLNLAGYSSSPSFLCDIPQRAGSRPQCEECLPHAQMTQQSPDDIFASFKQEALKLMATNNGKNTGSVRVGRSTVSMPSTYPAFHWDSKTTMPVEACMTPGGPACGCEFAHIHTKYFPADSDFAISKSSQRWQSWQGGGQGSMHLCLSLKDAALVLEKGWGERHLLSGNSDIGFSVPNGLVLIYSPRDAEEIQVCLNILKASLSFAQEEQ